MNSRAKGCRGERAFRDFLREQGYLKAYRGAQYCGLRGNADEQATRACGSKYPVVAWRRNGRDWLAVMPAETISGDW
jgi:hypothetical protein